MHAKQRCSNCQFYGLQFDPCDQSHILHHLDRTCELLYHQDGTFTFFRWRTHEMKNSWLLWSKELMVTMRQWTHGHYEMKTHGYYEMKNSWSQWDNKNSWSLWGEEIMVTVRWRTDGHYEKKSSCSIWDEECIVTTRWRTHGQCEIKNSWSLWDEELMVSVTVWWRIHDNSIWLKNMSFQWTYK